MDNKFRFVMPADLEKGKDGAYKVRGLASTQGMDQQGETIIQKGIDLTPIDKKKGILNWDHQKGPENTIGLLDGYKKGSKGLYVEGRLFKNHTKAKAVREIMESLGDGDRGRIGLSVEGQILERDKTNPKIIKKCRINAVALTMNPVNTDTFADLVKSMNSADEVEFDSTEDHIKEEHQDEAMFTAGQVLQIVQKALGVGGGGLAAPNTRTGGDALAQESMDSKKKKEEKVDPKKMKKMKKSEYADNLQNMMSKLQVLYPDVSRTDLWVAVQERMGTKFPDINETFGKGRGPDKKPRKTKHDYHEYQNTDDYKNLKAKGHTDDEIKAIWTRDKARNQKPNKYSYSV